MSLSVRNARLVVLAAWSVCLIWLWASGEVMRYLGPRTAWVVSFGAVALSAATILYARAGAGTPDARRPLTIGEAAGLAALLVPVLIAFLMAHAALGSLAELKCPGK